MKTSPKTITHDIDLVLYVLRKLHQIRAESGFGAIKLDVKDGFVVYSEKTVREHLNLTGAT